MATTRTSLAHWEGSLLEGSGQVTLQSSGVGTFDVSWPSRAEEANGKTSPEELLGAAHATCYSMSLSLILAKAGTPPTALDTSADVTFQPGTGITGIVLRVSGTVPGITAEQFAEAAEEAKTACPVSKALAAPISLEVGAFSDS
jgi:osmotically inducible protein OsmC